MKDLVLTILSLCLYTLVFIVRRETGFTAASGAMDIALVVLTPLLLFQLSNSRWLVRFGFLLLTMVLEVAISFAIVFLYYEVYL